MFRPKSSFLAVGRAASYRDCVRFVGFGADRDGAVAPSVTLPPATSPAAAQPNNAFAVAGSAATAFAALQVMCDARACELA